MPVLHPDPVRIPPQLFSEREVLGCLRTLPPEAHLFVRVQMLDATTNRDREIDFLMIHPDLGLVIIEVKGRGVEPRGDHWIRRNAAGQEEPLEESPGTQLTAQQYALLTFLKGAGLPFVPQITRVLALPNLDLREGQDLGPDLPACRILTREKLRHPFEAIRQAVSGGASWSAWQNTPDARNYQVRPELMLQLKQALLPELLPNATLTEVLAAEGRVQDFTSASLLEHLARNFSRGRFHLQGGPGSGKSLLGRMVTRIWASEGRKVLVVAFNKALTHATQCALAELGDQVDVTTFHDLAVNLLRDAHRLPECQDQGSFFNTEVPQALKTLMEDAQAGPAPQWDALVVDEAQDLEPEWVSSLLGLLRHPQKAPVLLMEDPAQSLFRTGRHGLGQPWSLDLSLRQHPSIRRAACQAFPGCGWEAPDTGTTDDGALCIQRSRPGTWKRELAEHLASLARKGIQPHQVMVLAPHRPGTLGLEDGQSLGPWALNTQVDWWEDEKADQVRMGTVQAFKGLEADVVIYLAPAYHHPDGQRLAYTAYSRARHRLIVLEKAIPRPAQAPPPEPSQSKPPFVPMAPPRRLPSEGARKDLLAALTAARNWKADRSRERVPPE